MISCQSSDKRIAVAKYRKYKKNYSCSFNPYIVVHCRNGKIFPQIKIW